MGEGEIYNVKDHQKQILVHLSASLPDQSRKAGGQIKQCTATILWHNNKLTSGMCLLGVLMSVCPLHLVFPFIFNQAGRRFLYAMNHIRVLIFHINTFHEQHI